MMKQDSSRLIKRLPASGIQLHTQVDIIERDREFSLIESFYSYKLPFRHHKACGCDGTYALRQSMSEEIAVVIGVQEPVSVSSTSPHSGDDTRMLNVLIGIKQSCSNCSQLGAH